MKYYKTAYGEYYAIEPWEPIPEGCTEVTKAEVDAEVLRRRIEQGIVAP